MSPERRRSDDIYRLGVTTESTAFRQSLETISSVLTAAWLALETILFAFGIHPGYILHRLDTAMDRLSFALVLKGNRSGAPEAVSFGDGTRTVAKKRIRVSRRSRSEVEITPNAEGSSFPGMVNLSGTLCYMNSILQAFASLEYLQEYLTQIIKLAEKLDLNTPVIDALDSTLVELNTPSDGHPSPIRPYHFIEALSQLPSVRRLLQTREHQDAHELFLLLTNAVAEELKALEKERRVDHGLSMVLNRAQILRDQDGSRHIKIDQEKGEEKQRLLSPWEGLRAIRRNCLVCGWCEVIRHEVTGALDVTVPMSGLATLQSCLQQSAAPEMIDDAYCDSCTLDLTINYYISEEQRLSRNLPTDSSPSNKDLEAVRKPTSMAYETTTPASMLASVPPEEISTAATSKPGSAKKRRAREARIILRKLEEVKSQGSVGEIVGEGKAKARELGLQDVKWVKGRGPSSRMTMIARPPRILALHLNRSGFTPYGQLVKKTSQIAFPAILDLAPFTTDGELTMDSKRPISSAVCESHVPSEVLYRLDGVICHYGYTHSFGHFVAYRRKPTPSAPSYAEQILHPGGRWLRISDADVSEVPQSAVLGERGNAFLLFYERIDLPLETRQKVSSNQESSETLNVTPVSEHVMEHLRKRTPFPTEPVMTQDNAASIKERPAVDSLD